MAKSVPWWRTIGRKIKRIPDNAEGAKKYAAFVKAWSMRVASVSQRRFKKDVLPTLPDSMRTAISKRAMPYYLSADSAKVRHSAQHSLSGAEQWFNAIVYHAPADMAAMSFAMISPELVGPLVSKIQAAAKKDKRWAGLARANSTALADFLSQIDRIKSGGPIPVKPPTLNNAVHPLSTCPYASPICRDVCLNTSGRAGMSKKGATLTRADVAALAWMQGKPSFYCGASNAILGARMARTHAMWAIWSQEGPVRNSYNDHIFAEIAEYARICKEHGVRLAVRLNGTSDIPVETLQLTNGKNLMQEGAKLGVIFYDYTKDYPRMSQWLDARAWKGSRKVNGAMRKGMPGNYWLSYSWSEVGLKQTMEVMRRGGNVVAVFRRSATAKRGKKAGPQLPTKARGKGIRIIDINLTLHELTGGRYGKPGDPPLTVVDGDVTDLRFEDPYKKPGVVVGLIAKGKATRPYTEEQHRKVIKGLTGHFVTPIEMVEGVGKARTNPAGISAPGAPTGALSDVDPELVEDLTVKLAPGILLGTTAQAT